MSENRYVRQIRESAEKISPKIEAVLVEADRRLEKLEEGARSRIEREAGNLRSILDLLKRAPDNITEMTMLSDLYRKALPRGVPSHDSKYNLRFKGTNAQEEIAMSLNWAKRMNLGMSIILRSIEMWPKTLTMDPLKYTAFSNRRTSGEKLSLRFEPTEEKPEGKLVREWDFLDAVLQANWSKDNWSVEDPQRWMDEDGNVILIVQNYETYGRILASVQLTMPDDQGRRFVKGFERLVSSRSYKDEVKSKWSERFSNYSAASTAITYCTSPLSKLEDELLPAARVAMTQAVKAKAERDEKERKEREEREARKAKEEAERKAKEAAEYKWALEFMKSAEAEK